jgi:hypothetical protein
VNVTDWACSATGKTMAKTEGRNRDIRPSRS